MLTNNEMINIQDRHLHNKPMKDKEEILTQFDQQFVNKFGRLELNMVEEAKNFISEKLDLAYQQGQADKAREVEEKLDKMTKKDVRKDGARIWIDFGNTKIGDIEDMVNNAENSGYNECLDNLKQELNKAKE